MVRTLVPSTPIRPHRLGFTRPAPIIPAVTRALVAQRRVLRRARRRRLTSLPITDRRSTSLTMVYDNRCKTIPRTNAHAHTHTDTGTQAHAHTETHTRRQTHTCKHRTCIDTRLRSRSHFIRICAYLLARACQSIKSGTQRYAQARDGGTDRRTNGRATSKRFERYVYLFYVFLHSLGSAGTIASWRDLILRFARAFSLPNPSFFRPSTSLFLSFSSSDRSLLFSLLDPPFRFSPSNLSLRYTARLTVT